MMDDVGESFGARTMKHEDDSISSSTIVHRYPTPSRYTNETYIKRAEELGYNSTSAVVS